MMEWNLRSNSGLMSAVKYLWPLPVALVGIAVALPPLGFQRAPAPPSPTSESTFHARFVFDHAGTQARAPAARPTQLASPSLDPQPSPSGAPAGVDVAAAPDLAPALVPVLAQSSREEPPAKFAAAFTGSTTTESPVRLASKPTGARLATGRAVWHEQPGRTASGEEFDPEKLTAAHRDLPLGSQVRVVNTKNGRSVVVRINDRTSTKSTNLLTLSRRSAQEIGIAGVGDVALYKVE
ncbi:MAG TPA: RlpA-like double-psi beta-barrel domain-containing protein [Xanthobacteraceae bacterium]